MRRFAGRAGRGRSWTSRSRLGYRRRRCGRLKRAESRLRPSRPSPPLPASSISPSTRCGPRSTSTLGAPARRDPGAVRMLGGARRSSRRPPNSRSERSGDDSRGSRRIRGTARPAAHELRRFEAIEPPKPGFSGLSCDDLIVSSSASEVVVHHGITSTRPAPHSVRRLHHGARRTDRVPLPLPAGPRRTTPAASRSVFRGCGRAR